jgi:CarD family transcriptional regulator
MKFSVGDKVVHPHRGPGCIVEVERREFIQEAKRYYVIDMAVHEMTVHVPVRRVDELGLRPAMPRVKVDRVLDILRSRPHRLPGDYKERQADVWEKIRTSRPIPTAEAVRDLTWRGRHANLTKKDSELLRRGQDFLAAEIALVLDVDLAEVNESIESALEAAMMAMAELEKLKKTAAATVH